MASPVEADKFRDAWLPKMSRLDEKVSQFENDNGSHELDELRSEAVHLLSELEASFGVLPEYFRKKYTEMHNKTFERIKFQHKMKKSPFAFKGNKSAQSSKSSSSATSRSTQNLLSTHAEPSGIPEDSHAISGLDSKVYIGNGNPRTDHTPSSLLVSNCRGSIVNLLGPAQEIAKGHGIASMFLVDVVDSVVAAPYVTHSILINNCRNSTFILASHQLRVHSSSECSIYAFTSSSPVIEGCTNLAFANYPFHLPDYVTNKSSKQVKIEDFDNPSGDTKNIVQVDVNPKVSMLLDLNERQQECLPILLSSLLPSIPAA